MRWIIDFLSNMEARRWRAVLATALLLGAMIALFAVGKSQLGLEAEGRLEDWLVGFRQGPWGLAAAIVPAASADGADGLLPLHLFARVFFSARNRALVVEPR